RLAVQVPGWRPDVTAEVDLIEEVARLRGYDSFPDDVRPFRPGTVPDAPVEQTKAQIRRVLVESGYLEASTSSLGPADGPGAVAVTNPLSDEEAYLRSRLLPGLIRRVEYNWGARNRDIRLFEVGTVFRAGNGDGGRGMGLPDEAVSVAGVITGGRRPAHWSEGAKVPDMDIWDLKYHFELAIGVGHPGAAIRAAESGDEWEAVDAGGAVIGRGRALEADAPDWAGPLFGFELVLDSSARAPILYRPVPISPPVVEDVALVLPAGVTAAAVESVIRRAAGPLLERLEVFDEYRGPGIAAGARSVAWHCVFRDPARTLRAEEAERSVKAILQALGGELDVHRREG
ncbi:MAG TPA: hypothetical protein VNG95_02635, partial [Gemmatimonadales bacterium]|nr:hypothetical protein [Gemmatimonadales bacterium]